MSVHIRKNGSYYVRFRKGKKQCNKTFGKGQGARTAAEEFDRSIRAERQKAKTEKHHASFKNVRYIDQLAFLYFRETALDNRKQWKEDWKNMLNRHILPRLGLTPLTHLEQGDIVDFVIKTFPNASDRTHGRYLSYLKIMFNFGVQRGYITKNPLQFLKKPKEKQKDFSLDLDTIKSIRDASPPHLAFAIELLCNTGLRPGPSELLSLTWSNVLWDRSELRVFAEKTQQWRTIPLKPDFLAKLQHHKEVSKTSYIIEYRGKSVHSIHKAFRTACRKVGVGDNVVLYDIRHWFCTTLLSKGVPVKTVSMLMGHSSAKMTLDRYAHVIPGDAGKAIIHLPDLE